MRMDGIKILNAEDTPTFSPLSADPFYGEVAPPQLFAAYPEWRGGTGRSISHAPR